MKSTKRIAYLKHLGCMIAVAAIILVLPEAAIALDAEISSTNIDANATAAAIEADEAYYPLTTFAIKKAAAVEGVVDFAEAKAAEAKAKQEAAEKAALSAEAKAVKNTATEPAITKSSTKKTSKVKSTSTAKTKSTSTGTATKTTDTEKKNPAGIPDKYTVKTSFTVKAYAYTGGGTTASGQKARVGLVAVDPSVIKLGTILYIEGYGVCVAADTGGNIKGKTVDLYMNTEKECRNWGKRNVTCYILNK